MSATKQEQVTILAAYCDWRYDLKRFETFDEAKADARVYALPARVTPARYILRYGGERVAMESGAGNCRKLLKRFTRFDKKPRTSWRQLIGSHERMTRAIIVFRLDETSLPFIDYWNACQTALVKRYGIDPGDAYTADDVAHAQDEGWTPKEFVAWIGTKYDLQTLA